MNGVAGEQIAASVTTPDGSAPNRRKLATRRGRVHFAPGTVVPITLPVAPKIPFARERHSGCYAVSSEGR